MFKWFSLNTAKCIYKIQLEVDYSSDCNIRRCIIEAVRLVYGKALNLQFF